MSKYVSYPSSNSMKDIKVELKLTCYVIIADLKQKFFIHITNITNLSNVVDLQ